MNGFDNGLPAPLGLRADVVATVLDEGALLLDLQSKYFYLLSPSAWGIVQLFEAGTTAEHARAVCAPVGAAPEEVDGVVSFLVDEELVEPVATDECPDLALAVAWARPTIEKQGEPLQKVIVNAFDPTIPLAE
jgi:hypothetical protein